VPLKEWCWARVLFVSTTVQLGRSVTGANGASPFPPEADNAGSADGTVLWGTIVRAAMTMFMPLFPRIRGQILIHPMSFLTLLLQRILPLIRIPTPTVNTRLLRGLGLPFPDTFFWNLILYIGDVSRRGREELYIYFILHYITTRRSQVEPRDHGGAVRIAAEPRGVPLGIHFSIFLHSRRA